MKRLVNFLLGYVLLRAEGAFPERLVNLAAQCRVPFWGLRWESETAFTIRVRWRDRRRFEDLAGRAMCTLETVGSRGVPAAAARWRHRHGFAVGLGLALLSAVVLSQFVLTVEVTGNETVPTAVILSELQRLGVRPGVYAPALDRTAIANEALLGLPELSFLAVNRSGTRLEVVVREETQAPEVLREDVPADVVAAADGIILDIHPAAGAARFEDGNTVARGEVLISGDVQLRYPEGGDDPGTLLVRAAGTVRARTWRTLKAVIPLSAAVKVYTGRETVRRGARILWMDADFYGKSGISYPKYDKITEWKPLTVFGAQLPVVWRRETLREYTLEERSIDQAAAEELLRRALLGQLEEILTAGEGSALRTDFLTSAEGGVLTVTMLAECEEQIGRTVERAGRTGRIRGGE